MESNVFIDKLEQFAKIPEEVKEDILSRVQKESFPKHSLILKAGQICKKLYFIESGLARTYFIMNGKEYTTDIFIDNDFLLELSSFTFQKPSHQNIEMIEDCVCYSIYYEDLQELYAKYHIMERIGRLVAEFYYNSLAVRSYMLKFKTTAERYEYLFEKKIEVIRRAPLGVIASYLGMSLENLSRVRRKK